MKPVKARPHGVMDYLGGALLLTAPYLFGFQGTVAATLSYVVGSVHLGLSLMTNYPLGLFRAIPFTVHGMIEIATAIALIAAPWIFGFSEMTNARNFYVAAGAGLTGLWGLTDYRSGAARIQSGSKDEDQPYRIGRAA